MAYFGQLPASVSNRTLVADLYYEADCQEDFGNDDTAEECRRIARLLESPSVSPDAIGALRVLAAHILP